MGVVWSVVCHDCKERLSLDKWFPPSRIEDQMNYIREVLMAVNRCESGFKYDFHYLFAFLSFVGKHKGHRIDWISDSEDNGKISKYKYKEPTVGKNFDFDREFKIIVNEVKVACILSKFKDKKIVGEWWGMSRITGVIEFHYSFKKLIESPISRRFKCELTLDEIEKTESELEKIIAKKINKNRPLLSNIFSKM